MISGLVTIVATGTPQSVAATMNPALPSISIGGIQYPAGSVTQYAKQITLQAAGSNAAAISVGSRNMVPATGVGVGGTLAAGASDNIGQTGAGNALDDVWVAGTAGDKVYVQLVG